MHSDDPQRAVPGQQKLSHDRAARLKSRKLKRRAMKDPDVALHQQRIAVPANIARIDVQQSLRMTPRLFKRTLVPDSERHRLVEPVRIDQFVGNGRGAAAEAPVRFLQSDHVGVHFLQHLKHAVGIAAPVGADRLAHIIAGDGDGSAGHCCANSRNL